MSELNLELTRNFDAEAIRAELSEYLKVSEPRVIHLRAADPPSFIHLLGNALDWQPLKAAAAVYLASYLATLGKRSADAT